MNTPIPIKIAIADDHSIFRNGLISSLQPYGHIQTVCEAENGQGILEKLVNQKVDVVLLDMKMPDMDGVEVCKKIKHLDPEIRVIGLSVYNHYYYISSWFEAGGSGYLLKDADASEIATTIERVYQDGSYVNENASIPLIKKLMDINHPSVYYNGKPALPFKGTELEILKLIIAEYTTAQIGDKLNLSPKTIENYRGIMMDKIGAKNIAGLVTYAIKKGIVVV